MKKTISYLSCVSWAMILAFAVVGHSQSSTATLSGTIEDQNSAALPGVTVSVENVGTRIRRTATTNASGSFTIPLLPPGEYTVLVEREGFTRVQLTNIVLNVGDQKSVAVQLKVGDASATVEVRADASLVRTDGSVGTVVDRQFVGNIPLNGRSFQSLLELTPGVVLTPAGGVGEGGQFSVNGQRTNTNVFTVDGVSANTGIGGGSGATTGQGVSGQLPAFTASGTTASLVSVDALQEFRIQTSTYAAEFGRQPGGQVSLVTRAGTNDFHGTVFDYVRNEAFDANNWFNNRNRLPKAPTRQHLFGGTFSGPIYFPNFGEGGSQWYSGKNRTFFFFSYEELQLKQPKSTQIAVPNLCLRGEETCPVGQTAALPQYQPLIRVFPKPNGADVGNGFALFAASYSDPSSYDATSLRLDHAVGKLSFFGRLSITPSAAATRYSQGLSHTRNTALDNTSFTLGTTQTISTSIVNDVRINFTTNRGRGFDEQDGFGGGIPLSTFGFLPGRSPQTDSFVYSIAGTPTAGLAHRFGSDLSVKQRQLNVVQNLMVSAGNHQLKFGVDFRRINPLIDAKGVGGFETISFPLSGLRSGNPQSGRASSYAIVIPVDQVHAAIFPNFSAYAQDAWKINPRLTLTYGLRWELVPPPYATEGVEPAVFEGLDNPLASNIRLAPEGSAMWKTRYLNFAPRVGASYLLFTKPGRELVIRGGAGVFYDLGLGNSGQAFDDGTFPNTRFRQYPLTGHPDAACAGPGISFPFPACALDLSPSTLVRGNLEAMDPNIALPRTYQWNFSAEQSLGSHQTITITYVGAEGRKLLKHNFYSGIRVQGFTYPGTTTSTLRLQRNGGHSDYRALQLQFQRRLSRGFQGLASYTFSRSRDTESSDVALIQSAPAEIIDPELNYGYSNFDVRHSFTAAVTYQVPSLKANWALAAITRDWSIDLMFRARTAFPIDLSFNTLVPGITGNVRVRPNLIPDVPIYVDDPTAPGGRRLNAEIPTAERIAMAGCRPRSSTTPAIGAFCAPPLGQQGNLPRGLVRGFGAKQLDLSLRREFPLFEKVRLQLRIEAFNLFNWPNFANPSGSFSNTSSPATFGVAAQTLNNGLGGLNALYQIGGPRSMQFSARVSF